MGRISATIRLRPIRMGLVAPEGDMNTLRELLSMCAGLWGGMYNPIIPVHAGQRTGRMRKSPPKDNKIRARRYIRHFEPDILVEGEAGLAKYIGVEDGGEGPGEQTRVVHRRRVVGEPPHRAEDVPWVGCDIRNILRNDRGGQEEGTGAGGRPNVRVRAETDSAVAEALFGTYPWWGPLAEIGEEYDRRFGATEADASPDTWRWTQREGGMTPLKATKTGLREIGGEARNPLVFIFDPREWKDTVDLWNLRIERPWVQAIPIEWWERLSEVVLKDTASGQLGGGKTSRGNGVTTTALRFGANITTNARERVRGEFERMLAPSAWKEEGEEGGWAEREDGSIEAESPVIAVAREEETVLNIQGGDKLTASFRPLDPKGELPYGRRGAAQWVNTVDVWECERPDIATILPPDSLHPARNRGRTYEGERVTSGREGQCILRQETGPVETIKLATHTQTIVEAFEARGIEAKLSEPGHIAHQMLLQMGGVSGCDLLAHKETLQLLNKMAGGERSGARTQESQTLQRVISRRNASKRGRQKEVQMEDLTDRRMIQIGVRTKCPKCMTKNWHTLAALDYEVPCERCLTQYAFPQGKVEADERAWTYRAIGPFAVPDYARGAYASVLALRALNTIGMGGQTSYGPSMELQLEKGTMREVDFAAWVAPGWRLNDPTHNRRPQLVVGEAKSMGKQNQIETSELEKLENVCRRVEESFAAVAIMRDKLTADERQGIRELANRLKRKAGQEQETKPVIVLTEIELFHQERNLLETWRAQGGTHAKTADRTGFILDLRSLAHASQEIYL